MHPPSLEITPPPGGGSASFASLTGDPGDNAALASALGAKLNLTGGTLTGLINFSGTTHAGLCLNNLTTTQRNAIATPSAGMTVWNTTQARMNVHNGSAWTDGFVRLAGDAMTGALSVTLTGLATTPTAGLTLVNSTDAGLGVQQVSPSFVLEGRGYRSTTSVGSQIVRFRQSVLPVQGVSASPTATWRLQSEINNSGTWVDNLFVTSAGLISSGGANNIFLGTDPYITQVNSGRPIELRMAGGSVTIADATATGPRLAFSPTNGNTSPDRVFGSNTSNSFYFGVAGSTPAAQTLGVAAGVGTNIAGANFSIAAGLGTGSGNPGSLLFQTSSTLGSGSTAQTLATRMSIGETEINIASGIILRLGNAAAAGVVVPTHTVTLRDSTGTTYRVPCLV